MRSYIKLLVLSIFTTLQAYGQQGSKVDSLQKALKTTRDDTTKINILSDLSFAYASNSTDTAMVYSQQQMKLAGQVNLPRFTAIAYNDLAIIQYYKGEYSEALLNNKKALQLREALGDPAQIVSSLNKIGVIYQELGDYEKAANIQLRVLKIAEKLHNEAYISTTLNNISFLMQKVKKYDDALLYSRRALAISIRQNDTFSMALAYGALENIFEQQFKGDSAFLYQSIAISLLQQINSLSELSQAYNNMGYLYRIQKKDAEGVYYYKKALDIAIKLNNRNDQAFYAANIGSVYVDIQKVDSAYIFLKQAMILNRENSKPNILKTIYSGLASYFIYKNKHDSALYYNNLYRDITDTIYSATSAQQVNELLSKYETEQKEQQIVLLNEQNKIKQLTINHRNVTIGIIAGSFAIALLLGTLFYNRYRMQQEARLQREIIRQQHLSSKAVIAAEDLERKRIAGDLHDGIGQMFSAVKMNLSGIADRIQIPVDDRQLLNKTIALVDESCKEVRVISHQMMPNVLLKSGLSSAIRDFIDKIDENKLKITLETFGLNEPLDTNVESVLYRVIQESVNNVIKHARATTLDIQLHKDDESITVTIEDNGSGFDLGKINENKGIGLKSIQARVAFLDGKVDYDTAPGKGTLVAIFIPNKSA